VPTLLMWAAVVYKLPRRTPRERGARFLWLTLLGLALAMTVLLPPVYLAVDWLSGIPNLARFLGNGLVLVAGWTAKRTSSTSTTPSNAPSQRFGATGTCCW